MDLARARSLQPCQTSNGVRIGAINSNSFGGRNKVDGDYTFEASGHDTTMLLQVIFHLKELSSSHPIALNTSNVAALWSTRLTDLKLTIMNTRQGAGLLTITSIDSIRHRFSGVFNFRGTDSNGKTINVTDGKIDNVEFFEQ